MDRGVRIEDVAGLKSRVSWGAIAGGSLLALATYLVLGLFFAGVGLSLTQAGVQAGTATWVAVVANVISMVVALFVGGWVTTQLTAGETRQEAWIHGVLTWGVVTAVAIFMVTQGLQGGYNALLGAALVGQNADSANWENAARQAGISQQTIEGWKQGLDPERLRAEVQRPENVDAARRTAMIVSWSTLLGTLLSIGASVLGALAGMGPTFRLFPAAVVAEREVRTTTTVNP
ncbi:MAG TPA: hypothetical protein VM533_16720 [Fimbriiglobus sp.]|jgi:hypothetical protein|nr:hypothetical protein [Fimbriiglobus sp.]